MIQEFSGSEIGFTTTLSRVSFNLLLLLLFDQIVLLAQMKQLSLKTQQRFSVFGTCFDVSNIIISHYESIVKIYQIYKMVGIYNYSYTLQLYKFKYSILLNLFKLTNKLKDTDKKKQKVN